MLWEIREQCLTFSFLNKKIIYFMEAYFHTKKKLLFFFKYIFDSIL